MAGKRRSKRPLDGRVAVVAGATRGAGRGIARMLGQSGATVYCTGRSSRWAANTSDHLHAGRPETIEETAELVAAAGGTGIPVRVDHADAADVAAFFARVKREQKRLDVLVNAFAGQPVKIWKPLWQLDPAEGRAMVESWIWPHILTLRHAAPLMVWRKSGLIVELVEQYGLGHHGQFYFDLVEILLKRLIYACAEEMGRKGVAAVAVAPGFMRTEAICQGFGVTEANWRDAIDSPEGKRWGWAMSESTCFVGRAVAALAADADVLSKSGGIYSSYALAEEYDFDDVDGRRPDMPGYIRGHLARTWRSPVAAWSWQLERAEVAAITEGR